MDHSAHTWLGLSRDALHGQADWDTVEVGAADRVQKIRHEQPVASEPCEEADVLQGRFRHVAPYFVAPPTRLDGPPRPLEGEGHRWMSQPMTRLDVHHHRALRGEEQVVRNVSTGLPLHDAFSRNGWGTMPRTSGSKSAMACELQARLVDHMTLGGCRPIRPGEVLLSPVPAEGPPRAGRPEQVEGNARPVVLDNFASSTAHTDWDASVGHGVPPRSAGGREAVLPRDRPGEGRATSGSLQRLSRLTSRSQFRGQLATEWPFRVRFGHAI